MQALRGAVALLAIAVCVAPTAWTLRQKEGGLDLGSLDLKISSFNCTDPKNASTNVCVFNNIVRWDNIIYYLTDEAAAAAAVALPDLGFSQKIEHVGVRDVVAVVPLRDFRALLAASDVAVTRHRHLKQGILFHPELVVNWWHTFDDATIMYYVWCQGLGLCEYSAGAAAESAVLLHDTYGMTLAGYEIEWERRGSAYRELFQCFGATLLNAGFGNGTSAMRQADRAQDVVYTIDRLAAGKGSTTGHSWQAERFGVAPPTAEQRLAMMGFLRTCAGLPPAPPTQRRPAPNVVLLNRAYTAGRSMLRLDEVQYRVRQARPGANVSIEFLEGGGFRNQATVFARADVLAIAHGAACSNMLFLPAVAGVVHVSDSPAQQEFQDLILADLPRPYRIVNIPYMHHEQEYTEPIVAVIRNTGEFAELKGADERLELLMGDESKIHRMEHRMSNYLLDVEEMTGKVVRAIDEWTTLTAHLPAGVAVAGMPQRHRRHLDAQQPPATKSKRHFRSRRRHD